MTWPLLLAASFADTPCSTMFPCTRSNGQVFKSRGLNNDILLNRIKPIQLEKFGSSC